MVGIRSSVVKQGPMGLLCVGMSPIFIPFFLFFTLPSITLPLCSYIWVIVNWMNIFLFLPSEAHKLTIVEE